MNHTQSDPPIGSEVPPIYPEEAPSGARPMAEAPGASSPPRKLSSGPPARALGSEPPGEHEDEWGDEAEDSVTASMTLSQVHALSSSDEHSLAAAKAVKKVDLRTKKAHGGDLSPGFVAALIGGALLVGGLAFALARLLG
ncbi:MAG: hypothetical protein OEY14_14190 [Myxococcales bacterium]|nr:hypothetical protein [Myxococcales bacterium]